MCECKTKMFRDNSCNEIIYLLENYLSDEKTQTNELMMNQYKFDSLWTRFEDDRRKLFVDHSH